MGWPAQILRPHASWPTDRQQSGDIHRL